jgi:hypothetical protein
MVVLLGIGGQIILIDYEKMKINITLKNRRNSHGNSCNYLFGYDIIGRNIGVRRLVLEHSCNK